jgi:hypothetical protein
MNFFLLFKSEFDKILFSFVFVTELIGLAIPENTLL